MIKSIDSRNIFTCWDDNLWATSSVEKGNVLADAYDTSKNVVLFFSANCSHAIQGYVSCCYSLSLTNYLCGIAIQLFRSITSGITTVPPHYFIITPLPKPLIPLTNPVNHHNRPA